MAAAQRTPRPPRAPRTPSRAPLPFPVPVPVPPRPTGVGPTPLDLVMAGVEAATYRYLATCAFAADDADMVAHWPGRLKVGAALVMGCVAPGEPAHGGAQITLAPRLTLPADQDEAERARIALHAVAARLAAYTRAGKAGRFVWRAWGAGYRLQQARDVQQPCGRCVGNADKRAERERVGQACQRIIGATTREPNAHVFIAHAGGHASSGVERAAI